MQKYNAIHHKRIGGPGMVVEIDECHLHSRKYGVGRIEASELWWVFGGNCRQTHEMFAMVVENGKSDTLSKAVFENLESGSSIYSDGWKAYNMLSQMGLNYSHQMVNHSENFENLNDPDVNTNTLERSWRSLRENVPMQVGLDSVESYNDKFFFHNKNC